MTIRIRGALLAQGGRADILIENGIIAEVAAASGGAASGGAASGGAASGGAASGGAASGGAASGDAVSGGAASGDAVSGGAASGGVASGDAGSGGAASGGAGSGGAASGTTAANSAPSGAILSGAILSGATPGGATPGGAIPSGSGGETVTIDASGMAVLPSLVNAHAHSAMTLLRGAAEDLGLDDWLRRAVWPREAALEAEDIYWGTRLAALEMIATGTTLCQDMYLDPLAQARAARDSGMRFVISYALVDGLNEELGERQRGACEAFFDQLPYFGPLVSFNLGAHSIYATSEASLRWLGAFARERSLSLHIHLAETEAERRDCLAERGMSPAAYLDSLGFLGPKLFAAHALWLDERDFDLLAERRVTLVHNPVSNMKLASGPAYDYEAARSRDMRTLLGTDGCASNNGLDLFADMKVAALLQKQHFRDARRLGAGELFDAATRAGHEAFGDGAGLVAEGRAADLILVDLDKPGMVPLRDLESNLVYAGGGAAVDTVICAGRILMRSGKIEGAQAVRAEALRRARSLDERWSSIA